MAFKFPLRTVSDAFRDVRAVRLAALDHLKQLRSKLSTGNCPADVVAYLPQHVADTLDRYDAALSYPGLREYVQAQIGDAAFEIVTEYQAMRTALVALRDDVLSRFPKDANSFLLFLKHDANGRVVPVTLSAAQSAAIITRVDAVIATLE